MADPGESANAPARKPRADKERNRARLVEVAKAAFADGGAEVTLDEIARRAGVGVGTLYRHFPTRDAVVEAVYEREVGSLADAAATLLETRPPLEALRAWFGLFIDYLVAKRIIAPALASLTGGTSDLFASSGARIKAAVSLLLERAVAAGDVGPDVDPMDLLYAAVGIANANDGPGWEPSARRLVDILIAGLRRREAGPS